MESQCEAKTKQTNCYLSKQPNESWKTGLRPLKLRAIKPRLPGTLLIEFGQASRGKSDRLSRPFQDQLVGRIIRHLL